MNIIAYLLSVLSFVTSIGASMVKGENKKQLGFMIILTFFSNFFAGLGYIFNSAGINGALSCALGSVIALVNYYFRINNKPIPRTAIALYYIGFFVINIIGKNTLVLTVIAILATFSYVVNLSQKDGKGFRFWKIGNNLLWLLYDIASRTYNQVALHGSILIFTIVSSLYFDRKNENQE